jgi:hypothetical protein
MRQSLARPLLDDLKPLIPLVLVVWDLFIHWRTRLTFGFEQSAFRSWEMGKTGGGHRGPFGARHFDSA